MASAVLGMKKKTLASWHTLDELINKTFYFVTNRKADNIIGVYGFKLHTMVADKKKPLAGEVESCGSHNYSCAVKKIPPPCYSVLLNSILFGSFVQTMPSPRSPHLSSLHHLWAKLDRDGASHN